MVVSLTFIISLNVMEIVLHSLVLIKAVKYQISILATGNCVSFISSHLNIEDCVNIQVSNGDSSDPRAINECKNVEDTADAMFR
jgi:hypothetical protein